jgi:prepilin peptidase CpaA
LVLATVILALIAYGDMHTRRIPNALSAAIAMLGLTRMALVHDPAAIGLTLVASAAVFAVGFLFFWRGMFGGGDAKLVTAVTLLIGYQDLFGFLFLMSLCGGALALAIVAREELHRQRSIPSRAVMTYSATQAGDCTAETTRTTVPYGVAIAAAGVVTLVFETAFLK